MDKSDYEGETAMEDNKLNGMNEMDDQDNIIELTGEDGVDVSFEIIGRFDYEGSDYLALIPCETEEDGSSDNEDLEVVFMEVCMDENEEEYYEVVDEDDLLEALLEKLTKLLDDAETNE